MWSCSVVTSCFICYLASAVAIADNFDFIDCKNEGVITPVDPYVLDSQDLVLTCVRKNKQATRHLYFKSYADDVNGSAVDKKYIERNNTAVTLRIPITEEDVLKYYEYLSINFQCLDRRAEKDVCITNTFIEMDYFPRKVKDLNCIIDNWETMICTWDPVVQYKIPEDYDVSCTWLQDFSKEWDPDTFAQLRYATSHYQRNWSVCPEGNMTSCYWDRYNFLNPVTVIISVKVTNKRLNISVETEAEVLQTADLVKPAPVEPSEIALTYFDDPGTVHMQWNHSQMFEDMTFNLTIFSNCDSPKSFVVIHKPDLSNSEGQPVQIHLTRLIPNTRYNFTLKAKGLHGSGYWSDPTENYFITLPAVPMSAPITRDGLFEQVQGNCDVPNCQLVQVYAKPLPKCDRISNTTKYLFMSALMNKTIESVEFSAVTSIFGNEPSTVLLRAFSKEGVSTHYTSMEIYPETERPQIKRDLVIEYDKKTGVCNATVVVLKEDTNFANLSHTIVWCRGGYICENVPEWYEMAMNETKIVLPLSHCEHSYRIGITTSGTRVTSGEIIATQISWVDCMYEAGIVPTEPLGDVEIYNSSVREFRLLWTPYSCRTTADINYVKSYSISYCLVSGKENCTCTKEIETVIVSKLETSYTVSLNENVKAGSTACVWVQANTMAGLGPRNSNGLTFTVKNVREKNTTDNNGAVFVLAVLVPLVIVIISILVVKRKCLYKATVGRFKDIPITTIELQENDNLDMNRQDPFNTGAEAEAFVPEHDSGTSSIASNSSTTDTNSNRDSRNSNDSGIDRLMTDNVRTKRSVRDDREPADESPLIPLLGQNATSSGGYRRMPSQLEDYWFDMSTSSGNRLEMEKKTSDEPIYEEINSISSESADVSEQYMYLHPVHSENLDLKLSITASGNMKDVENITVADLSEDKSVSDKKEDGSLHPVIKENLHLPEAEISEADGKACDSSETEVLENSDNPKTIDKMPASESLPNQCGQLVVNENQSLNLGEDALADGYAKASELQLESQTDLLYDDSDEEDFSESCSCGDRDLEQITLHSNLPTSDMIHIPYMKPQGKKFLSDTGISNTPSKTKSRSEPALSRASNIEHMVNEKSINLVVKDRTSGSKDAHQFNKNNKAGNCGTGEGSYSKATLPVSNTPQPLY